MGAARLSIAGMMTSVCVVAIDCAFLVRGVSLGDRSHDTAIFLLEGVLPVVNVVGVAMLLIFRPTPRRWRPESTCYHHLDPRSFCPLHDLSVEG
jgi:hypothetical protein